MARFEQRISDEEVTAAREKIAAGGASLRSVADEIPCAPSTLSVRIKKAEQAEARARSQAESGEREAEGVPGEASEGSGQVGPVETLRAAQLATRASGEPDWPTRVAAAKALAALRPEELEPKKEKEQEAQFVVYDLPPGTVSVLHRARNGEAEAPPSPADAPPEELPTDPYMFLYDSLEGESEVIGHWSPASGDLPPGAVIRMAVQKTDDLETAERWRAELAAGRFPLTAKDEP